MYSQYTNYAESGGCRWLRLGWRQRPQEPKAWGFDGGSRAGFFNAPLLLLGDVKHSQQEARFHALGHSDGNRLLHLSFTLRQAGRLIRVMSARDMHRKERIVYEQANQENSAL